VASVQRELGFDDFARTELGGDECDGFGRAVGEHDAIGGDADR
jgi:hypothetical protein